MADDELRSRKRPDEAASDESTESEKAPKPPAKKKPKLAILVGGVLVLIILGAGAYFFFARPTSAATDDTEAVTHDAQNTEESGHKASKPKPKKSQHGGEKEAYGSNIFISDFPTSIINLGPSEGYDYVYLKYGFNLELEDGVAKAEIINKMPKISSLVDTLLTGRKWDQIGNQRGRRALEKEIVNAINNELTTGKVKACYFTTFVAQ